MQILAKVNGKEITTEHVDQFIKSLGQRAAQFDNEAGRKQILDELINQNLFLVDAQDSDLESTEEFQKEMQRMKDLVLTQMNINKTLYSVGVIPKEVEQYFEENKDKYGSAESADTSHILVDSQEKSQEIYDMLKNDEINFAEAAQKYSKCPSKQKGGKLGMYPRGQMVPEYDDVVFNMEIGTISEPVKTQFGYHIIKVHDKKDAVKAKYEDVKERVHKDLLSAKQRQVYTKKVNELKEKYEVETL
ncbi:MAG: peptidylprolyl isomerase [Candidatus Cloacimonadota bacterium]|nr:peptidylprolyl isomerase [Candidatus Cloacimonadota bacterium]